MNRLLLVALAASVGLSACSKEPSPPATQAAAPAAPSTGPTMPPVRSAATPNIGKVLQVQQAGSYTYAEVNTEEGQKVWIAGGPIQIKPGDTVQWGEYALMQNFNSKTLNRTFDQILFVNNWGPVGGAVAQVAPHGNTMPGQMAAAPGGMPMGHPPMATPAAPAGQPAAVAGTSQGEVKSVANAGGYSYLEVNQGGNVVWLAAPQTAVKAGDKVSWNGGMVMRNFNAKSLGRNFDQIVFTEGVTVSK